MQRVLADLIVRIAQIFADDTAALHRGARGDAFVPCLHVREIVDVLSLPLPIARPGPRSDVGDRNSGRQDSRDRQGARSTRRRGGSLRRCSAPPHRGFVRAHRRGSDAPAPPSVPSRRPARTATCRLRPGRVRPWRRTCRSCARDIGGWRRTRKSRSASRQGRRDRRWPGCGCWARCFRNSGSNCSPRLMLTGFTS